MRRCEQHPDTAPAAMPAVAWRRSLAFWGGSRSGEEDSVSFVTDATGDGCLVVRLGCVNDVAFGVRDAEVDVPRGRHVLADEPERLIADPCQPLGSASATPVRGAHLACKPQGGRARGVEIGGQDDPPQGSARFVPTFEVEYRMSRGASRSAGTGARGDQPALVSSCAARASRRSSRPGGPTS